MALVSPGISISVNDQSQYVNSNVGSVPLVLLATAENKTYNNALAAGTTKANAGKLLAFTSQRDLVTAMGTPTFQLSSAGTPLNGSELNEYGLLTAYSALGLGNQLFAIRADVDLAQLQGTSVRPASKSADGTVWLDLANTEFGIYESDGVSTFNSIDSKLLLITDPTQVQTVSTVTTPKASVGQIGNYALTFVGADGTTEKTIRLWKKSSTYLANTWLQVGGTDWQKSVPAVIGVNAGPTIITNSTLTINTHTITTTLTTIVGIASEINTQLATAGETGIIASPYNNTLQFFITSAAKSNGSVADGKMIITDGTNTPLVLAGITAGTYSSPYFFYGTYAQQPSGGWFPTDTQPRPAGSIWWKTSATGGGWSPSLKEYSLSTDTWVPVSAPMYTYYSDAIYALDPAGGGINITHGQIISVNGVNDGTSNNLRFQTQIAGDASGRTVGTSGTTRADGSALVFNSGELLTISYSAPGSSALISKTITTTGATAQQFVTDILAANMPYVSATLNADGSISIIHTTGGQINIVDSGTMENAGFPLVTTGSVQYNSNTGVHSITNFAPSTHDFIYSTTTPYGSPADGTYWYYSTPTTVDIMINNNGWKGYKNVTADARGYNLSNTDSNGVLVAASTPTAQSDNTALVQGDLWLDSSDLINYPSLYRYTGTAWVAIDNTDAVSSNGIVFADARWASNGSTDVVADALPSVAGLLTSNYLDLDAPDYRLYPKGTLLFNTRRSGYNVKKFVSNYFSASSFPPNPSNVIGLPTTTPSMTDAWVSVSGLHENGSLKAGQDAQRSIVVAAMQSAVDSNVDIREDNYNFNLLVAPGYPELIPNLVTLNDDRGSTGFVIGDTPMTLAPNATDITAWNSNKNGNGLATASPYLGVYYPAGLTNDLAGNTVAVPASHAVLRTYLYNDNVAYQWFAPAGIHRGLVSNFSDIGYINANTGAFIHNGVNQGLRDALYTLNINPITQLPGTGLVVWGQVTRSGDNTSRNRVNVVRLENYLRTAFKSIANGFLFEPNDAITRKTLATQIESSCHDLLSKRGLYDFLVICDSSNNTSSIIANNQLYVDIAIEPMKDVEFIYIPIALYNSGTIANLGARST